MTAKRPQPLPAKTSCNGNPKLVSPPPPPPKYAVVRVALPLLLMCLVPGCVERPRPVVPPSPGPVPDASVANKVFSDYRQRYAASIESVADRLERGEIVTAEAFAKELQSGVESARLAAFQPLSDQVNDAVGMERWDPAKAAQSLRQIAVEIRHEQRN